MSVSKPTRTNTENNVCKNRFLHLHYIYNSNNLFYVTLSVEYQLFFIIINIRAEIAEATKKSNIVVSAVKIVV